MLMKVEELRIRFSIYDPRGIVSSRRTFRSPPVPSGSTVSVSGDFRQLEMEREQDPSRIDDGARKDR